MSQRVSNAALQLLAHLITDDSLWEEIKNSDIAVKAIVISPLPPTDKTALGRQPLKFTVEIHTTPDMISPDRQGELERRKG
jgi:hypothetical protein